MKPKDHSRDYAETHWDQEQVIIADWKQKFFHALESVKGMRAIFIQSVTHHVEHAEMEHQLVVQIGWKTELPALAFRKAEMLNALRKELIATLMVNGITVVNREADWLSYLYRNTELGSSYAKLCGVA